MGLDTLFNKRDYATAQRYWSPNYIQHSADRTGPRAPLQPIKSCLADAEIRAGVIRLAATSSLSTDVFRGSATRELDRGRHPSNRGWILVDIGMSFRTRRLKSNRRAVGRCSATRFRSFKENAHDLSSITGVSLYARGTDGVPSSDRRRDEARQRRTEGNESC